MKTGITGGIGSGKSYVCKRLAARGITVYDCDAAAKRLIRTSPEIHDALIQLIGEDAYEPYEAYKANRPNRKNFPHEFRLNKSRVAQFLLQSEENAKAIDRIVHPAVFRDFEESGMEWMESAIMYESGANKLVDCIIIVTAPQEIRIQRVMQRDGITREKVLEWMGRQLPQDEIRMLADYEIVNDGVADIDEQLDALLPTLFRNKTQTL